MFQSFRAARRVASNLPVWSWPALAVAVACLAEPSTAEAASFRCSARATINDAGPGSDNTTSTPCAVQYGSSTGFDSPQAYAAVSSNLGVIRAGTHAFTNDNALGFVGTSAYGDVFDQVVVSGLGDAGATLRFNIAVDGSLYANASAPTQFYAAAATASFQALASLSTTRGFGGSNDLSGCTKSVTVGISVCNGDFDYGVSQSESVAAIMPVSVFVMNGDILNIVMSLQSSSLAHAPTATDVAEAQSAFGHTMYWDGLVFDDASRNVVLSSASGFDYRFSAFPTTSAAPEPAAWALMIAGFGLAGATLRRRQGLRAV